MEFRRKGVKMTTTRLKHESGVGALVAIVAGAACWFFTKDFKTALCAVCVVTVLWPRVLLFMFLNFPF